MSINVDDAEAAFEEAVGELEDAGFTMEDGSAMLGANTAALKRGEQTVILTAGGEGDAAILSYTVSLE